MSAIPGKAGGTGERMDASIGASIADDKGEGMGGGDLAMLRAPGFWRRNLQAIVLGLASIALLASGSALVNTISNLTAWQYEAETRATLNRAELELYRAIIWLKDSTNFINSGADALVADKLEGNPNNSGYFRALGYIDVASGQAFDLLHRTRRATPQSARLAQDLLRRIDDRRGSVFATDARRHAAILGYFPERTLLLMQVQPLESSNERISYVAFDVDGLCAGLVGHGKFARIQRLAIRGQDYALACPVRATRPGLGRHLDLRREGADRCVSQDLHIDLVTRQDVPFLDDLALVCCVALACLLVIAVAALMSASWRHRTRAVLLEALDAADSSARAKGEFLANMSHEIRTPMNGVMGMAELLSRTRLDTNQQRYVTQIRSSGSALLAILNDVLDLAKIDQGKLAIDPIRTNIRTLMQDVLLLYTGNAEENETSLLLDVARQVPTNLMIDPTRLRQIVGNLVSNAVKFTRAGEVFVQLDLEPAGADTTNLVVRVRDTGIGITAEQRERLFERFAQAEAGTARQYGGTGLGLSIVSQLVELMQGTISVESAAGEGSTFTVRLPLAPLDDTSLGDAGLACGIALVTTSPFVRTIVRRTLDDACIDMCVFTSFEEALTRQRADRLEPLLGVIIDEAHDIHAAWEGWQQARAQGLVGAGGWSILLADRQVHPRYREFDKTLAKTFSASDLVLEISRLMQLDPAGSAPGADRAAGSEALTSAAGAPFASIRFDKRRCLIVDDNAINRMVVSEMLEPFGFAIDLASDGLKAIAAARSKPYDIVFMDCRMPNMDGYEATRRLCAMMATGEIAPVPIVALTANAMKGDREACLEAGMKAFLSKPVQIPELTDVLHALVAPGGHDMAGRTDWFAPDASLREGVAASSGKAGDEARRDAGSPQVRTGEPAGTRDPVRRAFAEKSDRTLARDRSAAGTIQPPSPADPVARAPAGQGADAPPQPQSQREMNRQRNRRLRAIPARPRRCSSISMPTP